MIYVFIYVVCGLNSDRTYVQYLHTFERFNRRRSAFVITIGLPQVTGSGGAAPLRRGKHSQFFFAIFCDVLYLFSVFSIHALQAVENIKVILHRNKL